VPWSTDPMSPPPTSKSEVLQVPLSKHHSLDVIRLPDERKYRIVFAERFGVQRREFVEVSFEEALRVALFLASVDDRIRTLDLSEERTLGGKPSNVQPREVRDMLDDAALRADAVPRPVPDDPPKTVPAHTPALRR
jgi:hypothetical protein